MIPASRTQVVSRYTVYVFSIILITASCTNSNTGNRKTTRDTSAANPVIRSKLPSSFLDSLSFHTFHYFWDLADSSTGNIPDRWPTPSFSSIAATGFGLTTYLVGVDRGYITRDQAAARVLKTLQF